MTAIVFEIDGTLYRQGPLRRAMFLRLLKMLASRPVSGWQTIRVLSAYRHAQESLRGMRIEGDVATAQIRHACERTGVAPEAIADCVDHWMERQPLALLPRCIQPGILPFLEACRARGVRLGALSDYPAEAKLQALGMDGLFDVVVTAQSPDVNVFKPDPRGLLVVLERLGVTAGETLYVGDRVDVDAATAVAAGVRCAILSPAQKDTRQTSHIQIESASQLAKVLGWR